MTRKMRGDRTSFLTPVRSITTQLVLCGLVYGGLIVTAPAVRAAAPAAGSIAPTTGTSITWTGDLDGVPAAGNGEPTCVDTTPLPNPGPPPAPQGHGNCDVFTLTVTGTQAQWMGKQIRVRFSWASVSTDYDMVIRKETNSTPGLQGDGLCGMPPAACSGPFDDIAGSSGSGATTFEEAVLSPGETGVGIYYVRAIYFAPNPADQYQGTATVFTTSGGGAALAPILPTFDNYQPPAGYPRRDGSGEPSIGVNWNSGNVLTMSRLRCNRTTFDDSTSPADPVNGAIWFSQTSQLLVTGLDPILFTDSVTGRTICGELQGAGGSTNGLITDDDLTTATATFQTGGPTQGVDHQSIGGGPPKAGVTGRQPTGAYPNLFYYASQQTAYASVSTSLDGGLNYLPAVPAYTLAQCTNLHGHIKVDPTGTVYLPNRSCGGHATVIVSEDNGLNWSLRPVPTSSAGGSDPSVGIGAGGRVYLGYMTGSERPHIAVSDDHGLTWHDDFDLGAVTLFPDDPNYPAGPPTKVLRAATFPEVVAGDNNRAAMIFLATDSTDTGGNGPTGDDNGGATPGFKGTWYPFIAMTVDGGISWSVVRADNDPLHPGMLNPAQQGVVCLNGTVCPGPPTTSVDTRNLLDFNEITVDSAGRILAVYADGCNFDDTAHNCWQVNNHTVDREGNQGTARLTIIRQRGGSRLFRAFDPPPSIPSQTFVDAEPGQKVVDLLWGTPADNGAPIKEYRIYRGTQGKSERIIKTVTPGTNTFVDKRGKPSDYYHVTAVNSYGESRKPAKTFVKRKKSNAR